MSEITIRPIAEGDVQNIIQLYKKVYGEDFPFQEFYDGVWIKKGVFNDDIHWLVAEENGQLLGSAAVMLAAGDADDLIGEVGRLVVDPNTRGKGIGGRLIRAVTEQTMPQLEFAFAECRTAHTGAQKILTRGGYKVVGLEPLAYDIGGTRESVVFVCQLYGNALRLRRNNPRLAAAIYPLADLALHNCGLDTDVLVDHDSRAYPVWSGEDVTLEALATDEVYRLLRLSRKHLQAPEVFGAMRLEHGYLKLKSSAINYLVLRRAGTLFGGLGYMFDDLDSKLRILEVLNIDGHAAGTLLELGLKHLEATLDPAVIQVDVSAYSPAMQQTMLEHGFFAAAYCPSMVYVYGERLDVVKMIKLRVPPRVGAAKLIDDTRLAAGLVHDALLRISRGAEVDDGLLKLRLFAALTESQLVQLSRWCTELGFAAGEPIFEPGSEDDASWILVEGQATLDGLDQPIHPGQLIGRPHLAGNKARDRVARAHSDCRVLKLRSVDLDSMESENPRLGMALMRGFADGLS